VTVELRPYQDSAVQKIRMAMGRSRRVLFVLPTGGGKTVVFSYIAQRASERGTRVMIVAHRKEIVRQISRSLDRFGVSHALVVPGSTMSSRPIQVAMVQTLGRRISRTWDYEPDLLVIDEAHHAVAGQWATVAAAWPKARVLGVTATPQRLDGKGLDDAFDELIEGPSTAELIDGGFLARFRYLAPPQAPGLAEALSKVRTKFGDFSVKELDAAVDKPTVTGDAVRHYSKYLNGAPAIAFCVSVGHAAHVRDTFAASGFRAASIDGAMPGNDRDRIIADFSAGRLNVLTSCDLISEGFDVPDTQGVLLLRPTKSLTLHLQQVGRALRPKADGSEAIILDHAGNMNHHGLPDAAREWSLDGKAKGDPESISTCDRCFRVMSPRERDARRSAANCAQDFPWPTCGLFVDPRSAGTRQREVEHVDGELEEVAVEVPWMPGVDVRRATGFELHRLIQRAQTPEQLAEIAKAKGYKRGWVHVQMQLRERRGGVRAY
jgi:DNA repair protein RadD